MISKIHIWAGMLAATTLLIRAVAANAGSATVWQAAIEEVVSAGNLAAGHEFVDDANAANGRALRIPFDPGDGARQATVTVWRRDLAVKGETVLTVRLRGENLLDLYPRMNGFQIHFELHFADGTVLRDMSVVSGFSLPPGGQYGEVRMPIDAGLATRQANVRAALVWGNALNTDAISADQRTVDPDPAPEVFIESLAVATDLSERSRILSVMPGKPRFTTGERATARVVVANPAEVEASCELVGVNHSGLGEEREVVRQTLTLAPGETREIDLAWDHQGRLYGHEIALELRRDGEILDAASEMYTVFDQPLWLSTGSSYDWGKPARDMHTIFYVAPATLRESRASVDFFRRRSPGEEYREFFSWSPGDISDLAPAREVFVGGEGRCHYRSKSTIRGQIQLLEEAGIWPVTYVNGTVWAESGYELFARRPEWFIYDANGEAAIYNMEGRERYRHAHTLDFDPSQYHGIFFQATLNHALPEVQEYIAAQYIKSAREMGFKGVRLDVRYHEVHPGERDHTGREIAPTHAEADRISAAAVRRIKELVWNEIPDFTFGYNYASPEETRDMPLTHAERCADGGWMLDEVICSYQSPNSPYRHWEAFARRMSSWGDHTKRLGGIYQPFDLRRGGARFVVDRVYSSVFRLVGGGRPNNGWYFNSSLPFGDMGRFSTRYGELFFGVEQEWIEDPTDQVEVRSAAPVMWKDMVFVNRAKSGDQLIVNLVNTPLASAEQNPRSDMAPPPRDVRVLAAPRDGRTPRAAWLLFCEAPVRGEAPALTRQALEIVRNGGRAAVTVPELLAWKMVVFEY